MDPVNIKIPFNKPCLVGNELKYISRAVKSGKISGNGIFTKKCQSLMETRFRSKKMLLTTSCTSALEMASLLINLKVSDEVILPSYTFVSTANAVVLRGAVPVFVDIRSDTLNIDERQIEASVSKKTKAIFPVHYAGVGCEMDAIMAIAKSKKLHVIEDAAQGVDATYKDKYLGTIGDFGAFSFHETKNCVSGEGGALSINQQSFFERSEIVWEKGTNRCKYFRGEVDKYTWVDQGSSFLPSEIVSAFLFAQLEKLSKIKEKRKKIYEFYEYELRKLEAKGDLQLPFIPNHCKTNYHMFYVLFANEQTRNRVMDRMRQLGILGIFHYIPLHLSVMGKKFGYRKGEFPVSERVSGTILRLPFFNDLTRVNQSFIVRALKSAL